MSSQQNPKHNPEHGENDPWVRWYNHLTSNLSGGVRICGIPISITFGLFTPEPNKKEPKK